MNDNLVIQLELQLNDSNYIKSRKTNATVQKVVLSIPHSEPKDEVVQEEPKADPEIQKLQESYGEMTPGKTIEFTLRELLSIIPRQRKKRDAYKSLVRRLREQYGVSLLFKPNNALSHENVGEK